MKNMGLKNFDNSDKINLHTFAVCAYGESPYLEECVQSLLAQKVRTRILIATSTPNSYIYGIGEKYGIPVHINHGEKGLAGDWNFAYSCATTPLVTLAHQDDRYYVNYTEDVLAAAKKCRHPLIIFTDYNELRNGKTVTTNRLLKVKRLLLTPLKLTVFWKNRFVRRRILSIGSAICCPAVTGLTSAASFPRKKALLSRRVTTSSVWNMPQGCTSTRRTLTNSYAPNPPLIPWWKLCSVNPVLS